MNYSIKMFGLALILLSAWLVGLMYSRYCKKRLLQTEGFALLLSHIEKRVSLFLCTQKDLVSGYDNESIADFVREAESGESLFSAFCAVKQKFFLSEEVKTKLSDFFSGFGKNYREGELKRISLFEKELYELYRREETETPKRIKLAYTLLFATALSIVIILL